MSTPSRALQIEVRTAEVHYESENSIRRRTANRRSPVPIDISDERLRLILRSRICAARIELAVPRSRSGTRGSSAWIPRR